MPQPLVSVEKPSFRSDAEQGQSASKDRRQVEEADSGNGSADWAEGGIEEEVIVAFRRHTLLPLDDCLYALQATLPI